MSRPPTVITGPVDEDSADAAALPAGIALPAAPSGGVGAGTRAPSRTARRQRRRLLVVGAVIVGAFVFLLAKGLGGSLNYFETVDQAVQAKATLGTRTFRLEGLVVPGTIHRRPGGVDFVAAGSKDRVEVVNTGSPPQLFQPDIPVVVVGHFAGATFVSNQIIVDHSAQYVARYPHRVRAPNGSTR